MRRVPAPAEPLGDLPIDGTACGVCRLILNRYTHPGGHVEFRHARPWVEQDHEPVPVPAASIDFIETCDFCPSANAGYARYVGDEIHDFVDDRGGRNNFSAEWSACRHCDELLSRQDLDALADRVARLARRRLGGEPSAELAAHRRAMMLRLWRAFLPTVHTRRLLRAPVDPDRPRPTPITPARLPKVRDALSRYWLRDMPRLLPGHSSQGEAEHGIAVPAEDLDLDGFAHYTDRISAEHATRFAQRIGHSLARAELAWISAEFTDLAVTAAADLPDVTVTAEDLPARHGLLVWATPVMSLPGPVGDVVAASWHTVPDGVWIISYTQAEQSIALANPRDGIDLQQLRADVGWLLPTGPGGGAQFGVPIVLDDGTGDQHEALTLFAILSATWLLWAQAGIAEETAVGMDRKDRKAYARNHPDRTPPTVRLVDLRRRHRAATAPTSPGADRAPRTYHVRWMVRGFWKDQPYGKGRALRKRIYIAPHLAGPDDKPLKGKTSVVQVLR